uniref:Alpha-2-macroglobulin like 1 n=1 Tax=Jaculus jaculus TaxID=51337 RepID=A0A8C5L3Z1_JACJA
TVAIILLSSFWLPLSDAVASKPQYILWVSCVIPTSSTEKACLHLLNLNESVSLSVVLEYNGSNITIFDQSVENDNFYACADFKVSQKSSEHLAFMTLLAKGDTLRIFERRAIAVTPEENITFVQTDNPIYKPGANVHFRVVTLNTHFKPVSDLYPLITVQDPQNNVIFQWQNVTSSQNITQLSFQLTAEPMLGDYRIVVRRPSGTTVIHQFTVNRDVLPRFEVEVKTPQTVTIADDEFQVSACAKYIYGHSVQGKAQIQVCREFFSSTNCDKGNNEICEQFTAQLKDGCISQSVNTKVFQLYRSGFFMTFHVNVIVTEFGTGVQISKKTSVLISSSLGSVRFENMDPFYRRGISYFGTLKFYGPNNEPMVRKLLQLELNGKFIGNYTTDEKGEAPFSIDTSEIFDPHLNLQAKYVRPRSCHRSSWLIPEYSDANFLVFRFYSRTNSFLKIIPEPRQLPCNQPKVVTVLYSLDHEAYEEGSAVNFFYLVMVKGAIYLSGKKELRNQASNGSFSFPVSIGSDLAPAAVMFAYTLHPRGEIVADSVKFQIDKCFRNEISMKFSKEQGLPGSKVSLSLQAAPGSFCALRAVDKSVLLLRPERELSAQSVYNLLPNTQPHGYFYLGLNLDDGKADACIPPKHVFCDGLYYMPVRSDGDGDISGIIKDIGLKVFTNFHYRKPEVCSQEGSFLPMESLYYVQGRTAPMYGVPLTAAADNLDSVDHAEQTFMETVRTNFPKTWIWDLISVDSSGLANLSLLVPDTITRWEAGAFCVHSDEGFGISSTVSLQVSQPFFVEVASPIAIVRNEHCDLTVTVVSSLNACAEVSVKLEASQNYEANVNSLNSNSSDIIKAGERKTYVWTFIPKKLGKVNITAVAESRGNSACPNEAPKQQNLHWRDTVVSSILVEPEGIKKETTQSFLICTKGTKTSRQVTLELPSSVVEGSVRAFFTVVGDILGVAMQNLDTLLQTTFGCGEQNVALLASNTYVLDYLRATEQLTEEVSSKARTLLANGYQKLLSFKNADGSYRTFCQRDQKGSIWLSALTFKTLERMKQYIFIDETIPKQTLIWLSSKQEINGCFTRNYKHFSNAQEAGNEDNVALTAYIVGTFLEAGLNASFPALRNGLFCLEEAVARGVATSHTHALLAYAFAFAGKEQQVTSLLQILDRSATKINNMIYWEKEKNPKTEESPPFVPSGETEKTCYVLLAVISRAIRDLDYASKVVQWLAQQMNSHGGFSATQDTPICLLALTHYMKITGSAGENTITLRSKEFEIFRVHRDNRLLVQHSELTRVHGQYTVEVEGQGCAFIQATIKYHVPLPKKASGFSLSLATVKSNSSDMFQPKFNLTVTLKYTGIHNASNMVLVDVKMLSGFTPVLSSVEELQNNGQVMKTDIKNGHVLFYLKNVSGTAISFTFSVEQSNPVSNIQRAPVVVRNYYEH